MARIPDYVKVVETDSGAKRYEIRIDVGVLGPGKRQQQRRRFKRLQDAIDAYNAARGDRSRGTHISPSDVTVRQACDAWLASQRIRTSTREGYVANLRPLVDLLGDRTAQSITKADIESLVASLRKGGSAFGTWHAPEKLTKARRTTRGPLAARTINSALIRIRAVFEDLVEQGVLVRNPAAHVKPLPTTRPELATLSGPQAVALLAATADDPFAVAWRLALSGLRRGELAGLRWSDVDLDAGTLKVTEARLAVTGGSETGSPKTPSSQRELPLPPDLLAALKRESERQAGLKRELGRRWPATGLVVVDSRGRAPHPDTLSKEWREALAAAGLPSVRLHDARHSCATLMHLDGVPAAVIAAWLGHTDARFTLSVYAHADGEALGAAAASIGRTTGGGDGSGTAVEAVNAAVAALRASGGAEAADALAEQLETAVTQLRASGGGDGDA